MKFKKSIYQLVLLPLVLAALCLTMNLPYLLALPEGGNVQEGTATFDQPDSTTLNITTSNQVIINWNSFNIAQNEIVNFYQLLSSSSVLNRIIGGGISEIAGALTANGSVILVNPAGINFSPTANINVGSLIASSLNISDTNFMSGNLTFENNMAIPAGAIINAGNITTTRPGGYVALLGSMIENSGSIVAEFGSIALAAGNKITLSFDPKGFLQADISEGVLSSEVFGTDAVHNIGRLAASGGKIILSAEQVSGVFQRLVNQEGYVEANSVINQNGRVILVAGSGLVRSAGEIHAQGLLENTRGGEVDVLGQDVKLEGALINTSGYAGGGTILIGGNYQGKGPESNALHTYVSNDSVLKADATNAGNGGKVVVWADQSTQYYGSISARGGQISGDGGMTEVSGKDYLDFDGQVDLTAPHGGLGNLLLDPNNLTIQSAGADTSVSQSGGNPNTITATANNAILKTATLVTALGSANVIVQTTDNITVANTITAPANANSLTLSAGGDINVNANIDFSASTGNLTFTAGGKFTQDNNNSISTGGGDVTITANNGNATVEIINAAGGNISVTSAGGGNILRRSAAVLLTGNVVTLTSSGNIGTVGARVRTNANTINASSTSNTGLNILESDGALLNNISTTNDPIRITSTTGNLTIGTVNAGADTVTLIATAGSINDDANDATADITGTTVTLTANAVGQGIGTANGSLDTDAATLVVTVGTGGMNIHDVGSVTLTSATVAAGGSLLLAADGALTLPAGAVTLSGAGSMLFSSGTSLTTPGNLTTAAGDITLASAGTLTISNNITTTGGAVSLTSDSDGAGGESLAWTAGTISTSGGDISMTVGNGATGTGNVNLRTANAGGGDITVNTAQGSIVEAAAGSSSLTGATITLNAGTGAGDNVGLLSPINVTATTINATSGSGGIFITESDGATLNNVTSSDGPVTVVSTTGDLLIGAIDAGAGDVTLTATTGSINDDVDDAVVDITGNVVTLTANAAGQGIGTVNGSLDTDANTWTFNVDSGGVNVHDIGSVTMATPTIGAGGSLIASADGVLTLPTTNTILSGAGSFNLASLGGNLRTRGNLRTTGTGTITMSASGTLRINDNLRTAGGTITLTANSDGAFGGQFNWTGGSIRSFGGDIAINVGNGVTGNGDIDLRTLNAGGGNITLTTQGGSILEAAVGTSNVTGNTINFNAGTGAGDSVGLLGSSINVTATTINATAGSGGIFINEADGATLNNLTTAGDGPITVVSTTGDLSITTVNAGAGDVTLTATAGDLLDATSAITGNVLNLTGGGADGDVGQTGAALNTTATTINATATGTGEVVITETDGATLANITTGGGDITVISNTGDLSVTTVNAGTGNVTLTATAGDILDAGSLITGNALNLTAGGADGDVGQTGAALNTTATTINATATGTGEVVINETDAVTLNSIVTAGGDINISAGGNMTLGAVSGGFVSLTTTAGGSMLDGNGAANNLTATAGASLNSAGIIGTGLDPLEVTVSGGNLTIAAGGNDLATGISVNINGTVTPSATLTVPVRPTGRVFFNGIDLFAPNIALVVNPIDGSMIFVNLQERFRGREEVKDLLSVTTDPFLEKKRWSLSLRVQHLRQEYQP